MSRITNITLLAAALIAVGLGCIDNPALRLRYQAEKKLFEAERTIERAEVNPNQVSPELMQRAGEQLALAVEFTLAALDSVSPQRNPVEYRELQQLAFQAGNELNGLLYTQRRYRESSDVLNRLLRESTLDAEELMVTRVNLGRTLQASGNWDSALTLYTSAVESFYPPVDTRGALIGPLFNLPAHIFGVARTVGDSVEAAYQFERAVAYYSDLAEQATVPHLRNSSNAALAGLYRETGQWQKEAAILEKLSDPAAQAYPTIRARIADIHGLYSREYSRATAMYDSLLARVGPSDTLFYPDLLFRKALIWLEQKRYGDARDLLIDLKRDHQRFFGRTPSAQLAIARTFELENKWDRAEVEYNALIEGFRGSEEAMRALLYVARYYEQLGRMDQADRWYQQAGDYYDQLAKYSQGGIVEARALSFRAELDGRRGSWSDAAGTLEALYRKYGRHEIGRQALIRAAIIHRDRLGEPHVADSLLNVLKAGLTEIEPAPGL